MIKLGKPPYLECSSRGDKRFSAFYARIKKRNNRTIEEIFQAAKVFEDGSTHLSISQAKGRKPINLKKTTRLYSRLWNEYIKENPHLLEVLDEASGLSDIFGKAGHCCQAVELWRIKNTPRVYNLNGNTYIPESAVYVGRGSPYGNNYRIGKDGTREEVVAKFRAEILPTLDTGPLRGKHLKCFCSPLLCHADYLLRRANRVRL